MTHHLCQYLVDLKKKLETGVTKFKFVLLPLPVTILQLLHLAYAACATNSFHS